MKPAAILIRASLAVVLIHVTLLLAPGFFYDDFDIVMRCRSGPDVLANLWVPQNEHAMPLGHLTTGLLVAIAPNPRVLVHLCGLQGLIATLLAMLLVYRFVKIETGLPLVGVLAAVAFGVTSVYQQAVTWFAAAFSMMALDTFLLALLAAQAWRRTRRGVYLDLCLLACLLAPGWFASGILAGPLCFLYLLVPQTDSESRFAQVSIAPLVGTGLFLAIALPRVAATILHLPHYQGKTAFEAFDPLVGLGYTCRSLVDNLFLGQFGITLVCVPVWLVAILLPLLVGALALWVIPGRRGRLIVLGAATILAPYLLTYSARSAWDYVASGMYTHAWSRYHLFPQLGLSLLLAAGLPYWLPRIGRWLRPEGEISAAQGWGVCVLIVCLAVVHLPRGFLASPTGWKQGPAWSRLAEVDAVCQREGISRELALKVLPPWLEFPEAGEKFNGWQMLHGSAAPRELSNDEARALLKSDW